MYQIGIKDLFYRNKILQFHYFNTQKEIKETFGLSLKQMEKSHIFRVRRVEDQEVVKRIRHTYFLRETGFYPLRDLQ